MSFITIAAEIASPVTHLRAPNGAVALIDGSEEGNRAMRAMYRHLRYMREVEPFVVEAIESFRGSYRRTQANDRRGVRGYFLNAAEAREFVRERVRKAREAQARFDAKYPEEL